MRLAVFAARTKAPGLALGRCAQRGVSDRSNAGGPGYAPPASQQRPQHTPQQQHHHRSMGQQQQHQAGYAQQASPSQQAPPVGGKKASFPTASPPPAAAGGKSKIIGVGEMNFEQEVVRSTVPVVCLVCSEGAARSLAPLLAQAAGQYPDIKFTFLNSDIEVTIAQELNVGKNPAMLAIFQGKLLEAPMMGVPTPQQAADFFRRVSEAGRTMGAAMQSEAAMNDLLLRGELFLDEGQHENAAQCFEQAVKAGGPNAAAFAGLALVAMQTGSMETAAEILKSVKTMKDHEKIPLVKRALNTHALSSALQSVIEELKTAKIEPGTPEATYRDAVQECQKGNVELAVAGLIRLVKDKSHPGAKDLLFKIFNASPPEVALAGRKKLAQALFI